MNGYAMRNQLKTVYQSHDISGGQKWKSDSESIRETHTERHTQRNKERDRETETETETERVKTDHAFFGFL